jgi:MFS family permease
MSRDLILIALSLTVWGIGEGFFFFFQPLYLQEFGADPVMIGKIMGLVGISMAVVHLPAGYLADRLGRRPVIWAAWIIATLATLVMAFASSLPVLVLGMVLYGFTAFVAGPLSSYVTAARGKWSVGRALTLSSAAFNTGMIVGPRLGGWLGNQVGFRQLFLWAFLLFLLSTLIVLFIRPQPVEHIRSQVRLSDFKPVFTPRLIGFLLLTFFTFFFLYLPQPLSQNYLQNEQGLNLDEIGILLSTRGIGVVVLNILIGFMNANLGYLVSQVGVGIFSLAMWQGQSFFVYRLGYFFLGGFQTSRSLANAQVRELVDSKNMGVAFGLMETVLSLTVILAPPLAGLLYAQDPLLPYIVSLGFILLFLGINSLRYLLRLRDKKTSA